MAFDLVQQSVAFADDLSNLLNSTVCAGPRLRSVVFPEFTLIGYNVSKDDVRGEGIPLKLRKRAKFYLSISIRLRPDDQNEHLMVQGSALVLATEAAISNDSMLLHYDYQREKEDGYPEAHLQICATSPAWEEAGTRLASDDVRLLPKTSPSGWWAAIPSDARGHHRIPHCGGPGRKATWLGCGA